MRIAFVLTSLILTSNFAIAINGKALFEQKCASCHGANASIGHAPILHGQEPVYLRASLKNFKNDTRIDHMMGMMNSIAKTLNDSDLEKIVSYLAVKDICEIPHNLDPDKEGFIETFKAGRDIANNKRCMHCHESFHHMAPKLFGQKYDYFKTTLRAFRDGKRQNPYMQRMTENLTNEEIDKLSTYFNGMILMRHCE